MIKNTEVIDNKEEDEESVQQAASAGDCDDEDANLYEKKWNTMYARLISYKEKFGHCRVPNRYQPDPQLGNWVSTQRRQYRILTTGGNKSVPLTRERAQQLMEIGFEWSAKDPTQKSWAERFDELIEFKKRFGNTLVPMGWKENPRLATWVSTQRQEYKQLQNGHSSRLNHAKVKKLDEIGFIWEAQRGRRKLPAPSEIFALSGGKANPGVARSHALPAATAPTATHVASIGEPLTSLPHLQNSVPAHTAGLSTANNATNQGGLLLSLLHAKTQQQVDQHGQDATPVLQDFLLQRMRRLGLESLIPRTSQFDRFRPTGSQQEQGIFHALTSGASGSLLPAAVLNLEPLPVDLKLKLMILLQQQREQEEQKTDPQGRSLSTEEAKNLLPFQSDAGFRSAGYARAAGVHATSGFASALTNAFQSAALTHHLQGRSPGNIPSIPSAPNATTGSGNDASEAAAFSVIRSYAASLPEGNLARFALQQAKNLAEAQDILKHDILRTLASPGGGGAHYSPSVASQQQALSSLQQDPSVGHFSSASTTSMAEGSGALELLAQAQRMGDTPQQNIPMEHYHTDTISKAFSRSLEHMMRVQHDERRTSKRPTNSSSDDDRKPAALVPRSKKTKHN